MLVEDRGGQPGFGVAVGVGASPAAMIWIWGCV